MGKFFLLITMYFVALNARAVDSNVLPPAEVFAKCYEKITDLPVDIKSTTYKSVEAGKADPVTACLNVFNAALFKVSGTKRSLANPNDEVTLSILRNFHQFHLSWFSTSTFGGPLNALNYQFIDADEPSLYITDALFANKDYSTVTTSEEPLRGIREAGSAEPYYISNTNVSARTLAMGPVETATKETGPLSIEKNYAEIKGTRVPVGPLSGITTAPNVEIALPKNVGLATLSNAQLSGRLYEGTTINLTDHPGGGLIGSSPLLQNNLESNAKMTGGLYVHRRWAANFIRDFMCGKLPSLMNADAPVQRELAMFKNSTLGFRQSSTCLACHTTLDNLAHITRNMDSQRTISVQDAADLNRAIPGKSFATMSIPLVYKVVSPAAPIKDSDTLYMRRPPEGRLTYRDYNNVLVDQPISGVKELGEEIAKHDDMYVCAAKRYYYFLTGVDIPLTPITIDTTTKKNKYPADNFNFYHRQKIVSLGKALRKDGSLKNLMQSILSTPTFKARNPAQVGDN